MVILLTVQVVSSLLECSKPMFLVLWPSVEPLHGSAFEKVC